MSKITKLISVVLTAAVVLLSCAVPGMMADEEPLILSGSASYDSSDSTYFSYNTQTGVLTISGTGDILFDKICCRYDTTISQEDFAKYLSATKHIIIEKGITGVYYATENYGVRINAESITIPSTLRHFSEDLHWCFRAEKLYVTSLASYCSMELDMWRYNTLRSLTSEIYVNGELLTDLVVGGEELPSTGRGSFYGYWYLNTITFAEGYDGWIGTNSFDGCTNLKSITILDRDCVLYGEDPDAFFQCTSLKDIYYYGTEEDLQIAIENTYNKEGYVCPFYTSKDVTIHYLGTPKYTGNVYGADYSPSVNYTNTFNVRVRGRSDMLQFVSMDHGNGTGTRSFGRNDRRVQITSYDKNGAQVDSLSRDLSYEIWTVTTTMEDGTIALRVKPQGSPRWEDIDGVYTFENVYTTAQDSFKSAKLSKTSGGLGPVPTTIVTTDDVEYVQVKMDDGTTVTQSAAQAKPGVTLGTQVFKLNSWINHTGENIILVRISTAHGWKTVDALVYTAS